jgi:hypothetical protein
MNYSDLLVVIALVSGLYGLIVALARQRNFLTKAVNPYRGSWLFAGFTCLWCGVGLLRIEAKSWSPTEIGEVLQALVTDKPLSTQGKAAAVAILLGLLLCILVVWCYFNFPRDPITFRTPKQRAQAMQYYISKLQGGLDYAVLMRPDGERIDEAWHEGHIREAMPHLSRITDGDGTKVHRTFDDQISFWRSAAENMPKSLERLDECVAGAHQGGNRRIIFDTEYGGLFFAYLRPPEKNSDGEELFLVAATLSQSAMNTKQADVHFDLMMRALRQIDSNLRVT